MLNKAPQPERAAITVQMKQHSVPLTAGSHRTIVRLSCCTAKQQTSSKISMGQICAKRRSSCRAQCSPQCIFCRVVRDSSKPGSRVIYEDELIVVLPDIHPAAVQHLLVLPREHIPNVSSLTAADVQLVRHMLSVGQQLLQQQSASECQHMQPGQHQHQKSITEQRQQQQQQLLSFVVEQQPSRQAKPRLKFGFHKPPFRSVDHLHLHCFCLPHKWYRWVQYQSSLNWITADELLDDLARKPSKPQQQQQQWQPRQQQQQCSHGEDAV